jgi:hypothetical protein
LRAATAATATAATAVSLLLFTCSCWPVARVRPQPVSHVVLCWLKEPGDRQQQNELIAVSKSFREIPGVERVTAGRPVPSTRPVVDSTFDVGIVIQFKDEGALADYEKHWRHRWAVEHTLKPLVARYVIYDIRDVPK